MRMSEEVIQNTEFQSGIKRIKEGDTIPIIDPNLPPWEHVKDRLKEIYLSKMLTNSETVAEFEKKSAGYLNVKEAVAVSSCTLGIILTLRALGVRGEVIVPSFTFSASGHAIYWAGARPVFVDCDRETWNVSVDSIEKAIGPETEAILAVHIFGNPADVYELEEIAKTRGLKLIFDAAHAFGGSVNGKPIGGFGDAEIFSLSPTKLLTGSEGGLIATNNTELAEQLRKLRNYGHNNGYDCFMTGLNARMSEFHAAVAVEGLAFVDSEIAARERLAEIYKRNLSIIPGIIFQKVKPGNQHTFKDFTIAIEHDEAGISRDRLYEELLKRNIQVKKYFYPPLHLQSAYSHMEKRMTALNTTEWLMERVITLPLYSSLGEEGIEYISRTVISIHEEARKSREKSEEIVVI